MKTFIILLLAAIALITIFFVPAYSTVETAVKPDKQADRFIEPEQELSQSDLGTAGVPSGQAAGYGTLAFLFGAFCALWAQNTGRNAWLWFFLGMFFTVLTVILLLRENSRDKAEAQN